MIVVMTIMKQQKRSPKINENSVNCNSFVGFVLLLFLVVVALPLLPLLLVVLVLFVLAVVVVASNLSFCHFVLLSSSRHWLTAERLLSNSRVASLEQIVTIMIEASPEEFSKISNVANFFPIFKRG